MKNNETTHLSFRELKEHEITKLVMVYERNNSNVSEMMKDKDCQFHTLHQLYYYKKKHSFDIRIAQLRKRLINDYIQHSTDILMKGKLLAITRALEFLEPRKINVIANGEIREVDYIPSSKDIKTAYDIIKIELGEPTQILAKFDNDTYKKLQKITYELIEPKQLKDGQHKSKLQSNKNIQGDERKQVKDNSK